MVDIDYTHGYFRELSPSALRFVSLLGGVQPVDLAKPFVYYELGCGSGHSLLVHAAAQPHAQFIGVDFNPTHIHAALTQAQAAGLTNVTFLEKSFAELLELAVVDADFVVLHGVWSWISEENRRQITQFIRQRLRPGGHVYISYNCLPGSSQIAPLQRLLLMQRQKGGADTAKQVQDSVAFVRSLEAAGALFFATHPLAKSRLASFAKHDPRYLAHEYFNEHWEPAYHADVVKDLGEAKLGYVGAATVIDNFDQFVVTAEVAKVMAQTSDKVMAETLKDYARNQNFRRDVFARGAPRATGPELEVLLMNSRFCLLRPRSFCTLRTATQTGEFNLQGDAYEPVLVALARAPMSFAELQQAPETRHLSGSGLRQALFGMAALGNVMMALPQVGEALRRASTDRFNAAALQKAAATHLGPSATATTILVSPVSGSGVHLQALDVHILQGPMDQAQAASRLLELLRRSGKSLVREGKPVESDAQLQIAVAEQCKFFFSDLLPWLRSLGIASASASASTSASV